MSEGGEGMKFEGDKFSRSGGVSKLEQHDKPPVKVTELGSGGGWRNDPDSKKGRTGEGKVIGQGGSGQSPAESGGRVEGENPYSKMSWQELKDVFTRHFKYGGLSPEQLAAATEARNRLVEEVEDQGVLDGIKGAVENAYNVALGHYNFQNINPPEGDTIDPKISLLDIISRLNRNLTEPEDPRLKGIVLDWLKGVERNVNYYTLREENALRTIKGLTVSAFDQEEESKLERATLILNWEKGENTNKLLRNLITTRAKWLEETGELKQVGGGREKEKEGSMTISYEDYVTALWEQNSYGNRLTTMPPEWFKNSGEKRKLSLRAQEIWAFAAKAKMDSDTDLDAVVKNPELAKNLMERDQIREFYESPCGREIIERLAQDLYELGEEKIFSWEETAEDNGEIKVLSSTEYRDRRIHLRGRSKLQKASDPNNLEDPLADEINETRKKLQGWFNINGIVRKPLENEYAQRPEIIAEAKEYGIDPRLLAREKIASAWNLLFIWNTTESADDNRYVQTGSPAYREGPRKAFHPFRRFAYSIAIDKGLLGPSAEREDWGAGVGMWYGNHAEDMVLAPDGRRMRIGQMLWERQVQPFPEHLFRSVGEVIMDGDGVPLIHKIIKGDEVNWGGKMKEEWWKYYVYYWGAANTLYDYSIGKKPVAEDKDSEWDNWGVELASNMAHLRTQFPWAKEIITENYLYWTMLNSLGPDINLPGSAPKINRREKFKDLDITIRRMLSQKGLSYLVDEDTGRYMFGREKEIKNRMINKFGASELSAFFYGLGKKR